MSASNIEFMKYTPVQNEKYLGIAVVRYDRKFIFRFKILDGVQGLWISTAAIKVGKNSEGKDIYQEAFQLDSTYDSDMLKEFILAHVSKAIGSTHVKPADSVFSAGDPFSQSEGLPF